MASQQTQDDFENEQDHVDGELEDDDETFGPVLVNKLVVSPTASFPRLCSTFLPRQRQG